MLLFGAFALSGLVFAVCIGGYIAVRFGPILSPPIGGQPVPVQIKYEAAVEQLQIVTYLLPLTALPFALISYIFSRSRRDREDCPDVKSDA